MQQDKALGRKSRSGRLALMGFLAAVLVLASAIAAASGKLNGTRASTRATTDPTLITVNPRLVEDGLGLDIEVVIDTRVPQPGNPSGGGNNLDIYVRVTRHGEGVVGLTRDNFELTTHGGSTCSLVMWPYQETEAAGTYKASVSYETEDEACEWSDGYYAATLVVTWVNQDGSALFDFRLD